MSRICEITGKKVMVGNNVSHKTIQKESFILIYKPKNSMCLKLESGLF